jgi:signal transduction histidine kinase/uncharacterized protein YhfF
VARSPAHSEASSDGSGGAERDLLRKLAAGTATAVGRPFFASLAHHVAEALYADLAFVAEYLADEHGRARVVASWSPTGVELPEGGEFDVAGTPCELTEENDIVLLPDGVVAAYPNDRLTIAHGLDSYLAIVMRGSDGERLGYLGVQSKGSLRPSEEEIAALSVFASRAAVEIERRRHEIALRSREAELAASRARVVHAADEARRLIGRNLHDGAQQRLVSLTHLLAIARRGLDESPERAAQLLERAHDEAKAAFEEVQELSRGLHPAGLGEQGLATVLRQLAARSGLPLRIAALPDRRLPEVIEVTVYYLVSEAVANAIKYAQATELTVEVAQRGRGVVARVTDDGVGGATEKGGSGLRGLADRVETLGGSLKVESPPGEGTLLEATIPLSPYRDAREPMLEYGYEGDGGFGRRLIDSILAGEKTASIGLAREWDLEGGPPRIGQRLPVQDHNGTRYGEVEVTRVTVVPFGEIDKDSVTAQAATDARTPPEEWREAQRAFYEGCRDEIALLLGEPGWRLTDEEPMVIVFFRVV